MIPLAMLEIIFLDSLHSKLVVNTAYQNHLKRSAIPTEDVSSSISPLSSDQSDYLNGANIIINGGGSIN